MKSKLLVGCISALLLISVAIPASAQAVYAAHEDRPRLSVGAGFPVSVRTGAVIHISMAEPSGWITAPRLSLVFSMG